MWWPPQIWDAAKLFCFTVSEAKKLRCVPDLRRPPRLSSSDLRQAHEGLRSGRIRGLALCSARTVWSLSRPLEATIPYERYTAPIHESFRIGGLHGPLGPHRRQEASDVRSATAQRRRRSDSFCHCVSDRESSPLACHANGKLKSRAVVRKAMLVRHRTRMDSSQDESIKVYVHIHIKKLNLYGQ